MTNGGRQENRRKLGRKFFHSSLLHMITSCTPKKRRNMFLCTYTSLLIWEWSRVMCPMQNWNEKNSPYRFWIRRMVSIWWHV